MKLNILCLIVIITLAKVSTKILEDHRLVNYILDQPELFLSEDVSTDEVEEGLRSLMDKDEDEDDDHQFFHDLNLMGAPSKVKEMNVKLNLKSKSNLQASVTGPNGTKTATLDRQGSSNMTTNCIRAGFTDLVTLEGGCSLSKTVTLGQNQLKLDKTAKVRAEVGIVRLAGRRDWEIFRIAKVNGLLEEVKSLMKENIGGKLGFSIVVSNITSTVTTSIGDESVTEKRSSLTSLAIARVPKRAVEVRGSVVKHIRKADDECDKLDNDNLDKCRGILIKRKVNDSVIR